MAKDARRTLLEIARHINQLHPELRKWLDTSVPAQPPGKQPGADGAVLGKASPDSFTERFREIVSDPLNLLIRRVPEAGYVDRSGNVILHNGNRVPLRGDGAYYEEFSDILVINRGVHEPLEEFCFQQTIDHLKSRSGLISMLELGAYWGHYSMWLMKSLPDARCVMVEPQPAHVACGKNNFAINGFKGEWINALVGSDGFVVDRYVAENRITSISILHSDIQGYECQMIEGAEGSLRKQLIDFLFVSTHSDDLHTAVVRQITKFGYRLEVSSDFGSHTTSCDGFVLASSPRVRPLFESFRPLGRQEIARASPRDLVEFVSSVASAW